MPGHHWHRLQPWRSSPPACSPGLFLPYPLEEVLHGLLLKHVQAAARTKSAFQQIKKSLQKIMNGKSRQGSCTLLSDLTNTKPDYTQTRKQATQFWPETEFTQSVTSQKAICLVLTTFFSPSMLEKWRHSQIQPPNPNWPNAISTKSNLNNQRRLHLILTWSEPKRITRFPSLDCNHLSQLRF